jgi:energy-converting hydrogenase Eha subunit E
MTAWTSFETAFWYVGFGTLALFLIVIGAGSASVGVVDTEPMLVPFGLLIAVVGLSIAFMVWAAL